MPVRTITFLSRLNGIAEEMGELVSMGLARNETYDAVSIDWFMFV